MTVYVRGSDPDRDPDWSIIRVVSHPDVSFDAAEFVAKRNAVDAEGGSSRSLTLTSIAGVPAVVEVANPSSPDDGIKGVRFAISGGAVSVVANGPVNPSDLIPIAQQLLEAGS